MAQDNKFNQFIDAEEEDYGDGTQTYEQIITKQIQRCVDVLSKEVRSGYNKGSNKTGVVYVEDTRELIINSVETLRMLMSPFFKDPTELNKLKEEIENYIKTLEDKKVLQDGGETIRVGDLPVIDKESFIAKQLSEFQMRKYRQMFEVLVNLYHNIKSELAALSYE